MFEKFYRSKNVENIPGSGFGLSIAKEIIEEHNGTVSINSILNEGTTVLIKLPLLSKK
jgi:signal transduction histidine kinase